MWNLFIWSLIYHIIYYIIYFNVAPHRLTFSLIQRFIQSLNTEMNLQQYEAASSDVPEHTAPHSYYTYIHKYKNGYGDKLR